MSPVPVFSFEQNKARKVALSTMGFVWHINSSTMHMIRLTLSGTSNPNLLQNPNLQGYFLQFIAKNSISP